MPAGTITLSNNSDAVTGSGTSFTTELKVGDFVVSTVGGVAYTLGVKSIESNTALTLTVKYTGPSTSGQAWTPVPYGTMTAITAQLAAQVTYAIRGFNLDKANWQGIFSNTQNVTITLPDLSNFTGPSWRYMSDQYKNKLDKSSNLADLPNIPAARDNIGVGYGSSAGTVAQGNDPRLNTVDAKSGGTISGSLTTSGPITGPATGGLAVGAGESNRVELNNVGSGGNTGTPVGWTVYRWYNELVQTGIRRAGDTSIQSYFMAMSNVGSWEFQRSGNASAPGSWVNGSDERHKTKIKTVSDPLSAVLSWRGTTYDKKDGVREVGLIAQDVEKICPEAITKNGDRKFMDGIVIPDFKYLNTAGAAAAYHTEAIKTIFEILYQLAESPEEALKTLEVIRKRAEEIKNISIEQESPRKEKPPVFDVPTNEEPVNNEAAES
ncbi:tail fiber domain-containing protein [Pantoea ananatis]|uniref:tail fiber domain-containing protein n=1 Tax=Pantoea ananas TaxID=553 RepID=UPI001B306FEE|nr:tail fiber domain-containing protein [Pantoea ananatis]